MNSGSEFKAALGIAKGDDKLRRVHVERPVSLAILTAECRACTAPNIKGGACSGSSDKKADADHEGVSKAALNRIKQQAKAEAEKVTERSWAHRNLFSRSML